MRQQLLAFRLPESARIPNLIMIGEPGATFTVNADASISLHAISLMIDTNAVGVGLSPDAVVTDLQLCPLRSQGSL